jgi:serine/threonine protein kinase
LAGPKQGSRKSDLWMGRTALSRNMITGPQLTEALLVQSQGGMKRALERIMIERKFMTHDQIRQLTSRMESTPTLKQPQATSDAEAKKHVGKIVNRVLCDSVIDVGEFVITYLGRLPRDPDPVALRLVSKRALRAGLWMDFLETVRGCIGVQANNLVEVIDVGRIDEAFVIVTRHQKGGMTLESLLGRVRRLKLSEALRICKEIAKGLAALHAASLVHRDVNPSNVLLGRTGEVQLMNAGVVFEPQGAEKFAAKLSVFGTPHYISPEALKGYPPDPMTDIYALGVLAYDLVTGVKPFEGETLEELRKQHLEDEVIPPHTIMKALPKDVGELLAWMLHKTPTERPTAPKLVSTLERLEKSIKRTGMTQKFQAFDPNEKS